MSRRLVLGLITCVTLAGPPPLQAAEENDVVVGRLGGVKLTAAETRRLLSFMGADARKQTVDSPGDLEKLVRAELVRRVVLAEAREKGLDRKPEVQYLMERGREQALISAYVQGLARPPAGFPTDEEIKTAFEVNKQSLMMPAQYRIARIQLLAPSNGDKGKTESVGKRAAELSARLQKSPDDFAKAAREQSDDKTSAAKGGEMGWVAESQFTPEVRTELAKLDKGGMTPAIRSREGWNIIRVLDKAPSRPRTLEESRGFLTSGLRQRWIQAQEKIYLDNLVKKSNLQIDEGALDRLQEGLQK